MAAAANLHDLYNHCVSRCPSDPGGMRTGKITPRGFDFYHAKTWSQRFGRLVKCKVSTGQAFGKPSQQSVRPQVNEKKQLLKCDLWNYLSIEWGIASFKYKSNKWGILYNYSGYVNWRYFLGKVQSNVANCELEWNISVYLFLLRIILMATSSLFLWSRHLRTCPKEPFPITSSTSNL